jgi:hypothetical protein
LFWKRKYDANGEGKTAHVENTGISSVFEAGFEKSGGRFLFKIEYGTGRILRAARAMRRFRGGHRPIRM